MNNDKGMHLCDNHLNKSIEHFHCPKKFSCAPLQSIPLPRQTLTCLLSPQISLVWSNISSKCSHIVRILSVDFFWFWGSCCCIYPFSASFTAHLSSIHWNLVFAPLLYQNCLARLQMIFRPLNPVDHSLSYLISKGHLTLVTIPSFPLAFMTPYSSFLLSVWPFVLFPLPCIPYMLVWT